MRPVWRRRRPGEPDNELALGVVAVPLVALAAWAITRLPRGWTPVCRLHAWTGVPCPTCGAYRAVSALARGRLSEAAAVQPLITVLVLAGLAYAACAWVVVLGRLPRLRFEDVTPVDRRVALVVAVLAVLLNWAYLAWRGV